MRILLFAAPMTAAQNVAIGQLADALRAEGHKVGVRQLNHFRLEKEPADRVVFALTNEEAEAFKGNLMEVTTIFGGPEIDPEKLFDSVKLPSEEAELKTFADDGFGGFAAKYSDEDKTNFLSPEQAKAEAVERGLEVTPATTQEELEHMLGVDIHPGAQAADRVSDKLNNESTTLNARVGLRTQDVLPTLNGMDITRFNDEQLRATAVRAGLKVSPTMKRETIINKLTQLGSNQLGADGPVVPAPEGGQSNAPQLEPLEGKTVDQLKVIAGGEGVDLQGVTLKDDIVAKIQAHRDANPPAAESQAKEEGGNG